MPVETLTPTVEARVVIQNRLGLHARPAMSFVDVANAFTSEVRVRKGEQVVDGKSIMQMMMLAATQGTELIISATGKDAQNAINAIKELIDRHFDEE
ncbi:MAG: HPr family phosphocarrier protein [Phycisphaerales bacterium]|nr:HPr family phosphocarrier protein [Phycisphaerales bacterium]